MKETEINKKESALLKEIESQASKLSKQPPVFTNISPRRNSDCDNGYSSCRACLENEGCGWCRNPARCLAHNVNAQEGVGEDGLVAGLCAAEQWSSSLTSKLTFLSLDIFGKDTNSEKVRLVNILALLSKADADIVTFQEAASWLLDGLLQDSWAKKTYHFTKFGTSGHTPGGLLILAKTALSGVSYYEQVHPGQTQNDERGKLLLIQTKINQRPITVATTTLDWRSAASRAGSLDFIFSTLQPFQDVFLSGGFNFDAHSQPETNHVPVDYVDVWPNVYPNTTNFPGYTWDPLTNEYAYQSDKKSQASRIDKIFIRSTEWMARTISLVGCSAKDVLCEKKSSFPDSSPSFKRIPSRELQASYVSNHYGLLVEFSHFEAHCM